MYICMYVCVYIYIYTLSIILLDSHHCVHRIVFLLAQSYTRSPLEDSRLFAPSPWKILAATNEKYLSEQPSPWRKSSKRKSCYGDRV